MLQMLWYPLCNCDKNVTFPSPVACTLEFDMSNAVLIYETKQINTIWVRSKIYKEFTI